MDRTNHQVHNICEHRCKIGCYVCGHSRNLGSPTLCNHKICEVYAILMSLIAVPGLLGEFSTVKMDGNKGGKGALLGELSERMRACERMPMALD